MISNFLFILIIISPSVFLALRFEKRIEETIPVSVMGIVCLLFLFGLVNLLDTGMIALYVMAAILCVFSLLHLIKKRSWKLFCQNIITPGFLFYSALCIGLSVWNFGKLACRWDEFTHWVDVVKNAVALNDFATNAAADAAFPSYPPAMMLFQYALQKVYLLVKPAAEFCEWRVYFAYQIFGLSVMMPFFHNVTFRQPIRFVMCGAVVLLAPLLFFADFYKSVYIDPILGILFGSGMAMVMLRPKTDWLYVIYVFLLCAVLTISKDVGLFFSLVIAAAFAVDWISNAKDYKICSRMLTGGMAFAAAYVPKILWKYEVNNAGVRIAFGNKIDWNILLDVILGKDTSYRTQVVHLYRDALYGKTISLGDHFPEINYIGLILVFIVALCCLYFLYGSKLPERRKSTASVMGLSAFLLVGYTVGLCVMYMFKFYEYEAVRLASMERYLNIAFLGVWMFLLFLFVNSICEWHRKCEILLLLLLMMFHITPARIFGDLVQGKDVQDSIAVRYDYKKLDERVKEICDGNDRIYFIAQETTGFDYWVFRFSCRPNRTSEITEGWISGWSIGEPFYEGDVWTYKMDPETWRSQLLEQFDYVALHKINEYFIEHYGYLFSDSAEIEVGELYRVNQESGMLEKCK